MPEAPGQEAVRAGVLLLRLQLGGAGRSRGLHFHGGDVADRRGHAEVVGPGVSLLRGYRARPSRPTAWTSRSCGSLTSDHDGLTVSRGLSMTSSRRSPEERPPACSQQIRPRLTWGEGREPGGGGIIPAGPSCTSRGDSRRMRPGRRPGRTGSLRRRQRAFEGPTWSTGPSASRRWCCRTAESAS